jgi:cytochrome P450
MARKTSDSGGCPVVHGDALLQHSRIDPLIHNNPFPFYSALRRDEPVHYDPKLDTYLVSRYDDVFAVMRDPVTFSLEHGYQEQYKKGVTDEYRDILEREGGGFFRDVIACDPPAHTRLRRLVEKAFTVHRVKTLEPRIRQIVADIIDPLAGRGYGDGIKDIGVPMTARVICEQLGFDVDEVGPERMKRWGTAHLAQFGGFQSPEQVRANAREVCDMQNYIIPRIRAREQEPQEDMTSDLVHARLEDEHNPTLSFEEKVSCVRALLIAGNDTTAAALANTMMILALQPQLATQLYGSLDDDRLYTRFVEEILRLQPPVHGLFRMVTREVELGGKRLPKGTQIMVVFASANDDETAFACPRELNTARTKITNHLTFGAGIHYCIGANLARMELKVAAQEIIRRLDNIKLAIPVEKITYLPTLASQTVACLPLTFSRRM